MVLLWTFFSHHTLSSSHAQKVEWINSKCFKTHWGQWVAIDEIVHIEFFVFSGTTFVKTIVLNTLTRPNSSFQFVLQSPVVRNAFWVGIWHICMLRYAKTDEGIKFWGGTTWVMLFNEWTCCQPMFYDIYVRIMSIIVTFRSSRQRSLEPHSLFLGPNSLVALHSRLTRCQMVHSLHEAHTEQRYLDFDSEERRRPKLLLGEV